MTDDDFSAYYEKLKKIPTLSEEEERSLLKKIKRGDMEAYRHFIASNMRLVISRVLTFCDSRDPRAMDMVSDGALGLIRAVERFDCSKPYRFSTYAVFWINSFIGKSMKFFQKETNATITNLRKKFKLAYTILRVATGEEPTDEEVAAYLRWPSYTLAAYQKHANPKTTISHDQMLIDSVPARNSTPDEIPAIKDTEHKLSKFLGELTATEEDIVRRHYGIGCEEETYRSIAEFYGLTKEMIRQIENKALRKLFVMLKENNIPPDAFARDRGD